MMTSNILRQEVLKSFKKLHRTSCSVFKNDNFVLDSARKEINKEFKKNKHVSNVDSIKELIELANEVAFQLRTTVVEVEQTKAGAFRMNFRPDMFQELVNPPAKKCS